MEIEFNFRPSRQRGISEDIQSILTWILFSRRIEHDLCVVGFRLSFSSIDQTTLTVRLLVNRHAQSHVVARIESNQTPPFHSAMFVTAIIEVSLLPRREEFGHAMHSASLDEMDDDDDRCSIGNVAHEHEQFNHLIKFSFCSTRECVRSS